MVSSLLPSGELDIIRLVVVCKHRFCSDENAGQPKALESPGKAIDSALTAAGWVVQERSDTNLSAGPGIAIENVTLRTHEKAIVALDGRLSLSVSPAELELPKAPSWPHVARSARKSPAGRRRGTRTRR